MQPLEFHGGLLRRAWRGAIAGRESGPKLYFPEYRGRELEFARNVLGQKSLWAAQRHFIEAVFEHQRVSWRSGRKNGKTRAISVLALTFLFTRPSVVITLGATGRQVRDIIWDEIRKMYAKAARGLPGREPDIAQLRLGPGHYAVGFSTDQPTRIQGVHADVVAPEDPDSDVTPEELAALHAQAAAAGDTSDLLIICDETPGIAQPILDAIKGSISGPNAYFVMTGNPTLDETEEHEFAKSHQEGSMYHRVKSAVLPSPDDPLTADAEFTHVPNWLVPDTWKEERLREWGEDSPLYWAHVLGRFAGEGVDRRIISLELLRAAAAQPDPNVSTGRQVGVDIAAEGGDMCAASLWQNGLKIAEHTWPGGGPEGLMETVATIESLRVEWAIDPERASEHPKQFAIPASHIHLDATGVGAGVVARLRQRGLYVDAVDFGSAPEEDWDDLHGETIFVNRKAELYWTLRRALQEGLAKIPAQYEQSWREHQWQAYELRERSGGTAIKVESKDDVRKKYGRSPDVADADVLAWSRAGQGGLSLEWV